MTNRALLGSLFAFLAAGVPVGGVFAQTAPVVLRVISPTSSDGSFGLELTGARQEECDALASKVALDGGASLDVRALRSCQYAVTPSTALAKGRYCISVREFTGTIDEACFEVTGVTPEASAAQLALEPAGPDSWLPGGCRVCADATQNTCTRQARQRALRLNVGGVGPEVASRYAFAFVDLSQSSDPPRDADYFLLHVPLSEPLALMPRSADKQACLALYARAFTASTSIKVGEVCAPAVLPDTQPAPLTAGRCEREWCEDNRADCITSSLPVCGQYPSACTPDAGRPASDAGPTLDAASPLEAEASVIDGSTRTRKNTSGCALAAPASADAGWLLVLLGGWLRRRRSGARAPAFA